MPRGSAAERSSPWTAEQIRAESERLIEPKMRALRRYCAVHGYDERRILAVFDWCSMHRCVAGFADEIERVAWEIAA